MRGIVCYLHTELFTSVEVNKYRIDLFQIPPEMSSNLSLLNKNNANQFMQPLQAFDEYLKN